MTGLINCMNQASDMNFGGTRFDSLSSYWVVLWLKNVL
jgi:hypothetical protein